MRPIHPSRPFQVSRPRHPPGSVPPRRAVLESLEQEYEKDKGL
jgi:hypothetical protein